MNRAIYTNEEMMVVSIARQVRDFETVAVGAVSPIPAAGCILAEQMYAPNITLLMLDVEEYYPFSAGSSELHFLAQRGELDVFFLSGVQIDEHANFNLHVIGNYRRPEVRLAGAYGSGMLYYMARRVIFFRTEHSLRTFVPKVDFVSGAGVTPDTVYRKGGPSLVITPKGVLEWDNRTAQWKILYVQPASSYHDVQAHSGFELRPSGSFRYAAPPTTKELSCLRTVARYKLETTYPDFFQNNVLRD